MRAYIQSLEGIHLNGQGATAERGFKRLNVECVHFLDEEDLDGIRREDVMVASRANTERRLSELGALPEPIAYPEPLLPFLGRRVWRCDSTDIVAEDLPLFVRSAEGARFNPIAAFEMLDLEECGVTGAVWASEVVWFVSSWRCFVRRGQILATTPFEGDPGKAPDLDVVARAVAAWSDAPAGYALDFGVAEDGRTMLIRARDGWCLGPCGLGERAYALLLAARWAELVGVEDTLANLGI